MINVNNNQPEEYIIDDICFYKFIEWQEIKKRTSIIANQINEDYKGRQPLFLIALNGAMFWAVELLKEINLQCKLETIHAKSYGNAMQSDGNVSVMYNNMDLENKDIIIIEDIVDTGYTMQKLLETINIQKPKSVAIAALITKPEKIVINIKIDYLGFAIPPEFIIGCGMDYKEFGRNLRGIYRLKDNKNSEI